jgi:scyllo-inositol 2-dehydrogenase (NADP+)
MSKKLRCVVVGLGRVAWNFHIPGLLSHPELFELSALVDPDLARLHEAAEKTGARILCQDCADLPADRIDLAIIASPTHLHKEQTLFFFKHGVDVFTDKPCAVNFKDAMEMGEAANRFTRKIMVYQPWRKRGMTVDAAAILASGKLGRVYMMRRTETRFVRRDDWQAKSAYGGGMLLNYGAHDIDQLFYLAGGDSPLSVRCELRRILSLGDAEDFVHALIRGRSQILHEIFINMAQAVEQPQMTLYGDLGTAELDTENNWLLRWCPAAEMPPLELQNSLAAKQRMYPAESLPWREESFPLSNDVFDYYKACHEYYALGHKALVPFSETLEVMRTIDLCRADSEKLNGEKTNLYSET